MRQFLLQFTAIFIATVSVSAQEGPKESEPDDPFRQIEILAMAMEMIRQDYVDDSKIDYESMMGAALDGMLKNLDPHSGYIPKSALEEMRNDTGGTYEGVGITVAIREGSLRIVSVREDGPASAAGILPGDEIVRIAETSTVKLSLDEAIKMLKGKPGESLKMVVRRPATGAFTEVELVRSVLKQDTVKDWFILPKEFGGDKKIGYVRLLQFGHQTPDDLSLALDELEEAGMQGLILDLRNNPGGLLTAAVAVCGQFLPAGTVVITTEGRRPSQNPPPYRTPGTGKPKREYPVVVLVNHASASGAECVAGALKDLKRAAIVGETTFGKGSVQSIVELPGGGAMRLTTAKYYTPSHNLIHGHGIKPNIVTTLTTEQEEKVAEWRAKDGTPEERAASLVGLGDHQLERAADTLRGVVTYEEALKRRPVDDPDAESPPEDQPED